MIRCCYSPAMILVGSNNNKIRTRTLETSAEKLLVVSLSTISLSSAAAAVWKRSFSFLLARGHHHATSILRQRCQQQMVCRLTDERYQHQSVPLSIPESQIHTTSAAMTSSTTTNVTNTAHDNDDSDDDTMVKITFVLADGQTQKTVDARIGSNILRVAQANDIDLEGACEGVCACSTCHVILSPSLYQQLLQHNDDNSSSTIPSEDEEDMLDMAYGLTSTSRLGCQIVVTKHMNHAVISLPKATRNFYVDGHVPKPH
jgi:ferredoxin-2, mitochondrial